MSVSVYLNVKDLLRVPFFIIGLRIGRCGTALSAQLTSVLNNTSQTLYVLARTCSSCMIKFANNQQHHLRLNASNSKENTNKPNHSIGFTAATSAQPHPMKARDGWWCLMGFSMGSAASSARLKLFGLSWEGQGKPFQGECSKFPILWLFGRRAPSQHWKPIHELHWMKYHPDMKLLDKQ